MAGINSLVGVCPVGARTGRRRPRRSHPPRRSDAPLSPASDPPRHLRGQRYRRVKRTIASDLDRSRTVVSCHVTGPTPFDPYTRADGGSAFAIASRRRCPPYDPAQSTLPPRQSDVQTDVVLVWRVRPDATLRFHVDRVLVACGGAYRVRPRTERIVSECVFWVADAVTVKCSAAADEIAAAYRVPEAKELSVVPDGNYIESYENDVSRATARSDLGIDEESFVFVFFGQIRPYKGVPELVEAFSSLDLPDAELWIVGNPHTDDIEAQVTALAASDPRIETRLAFVPDDRIQYYLNAADVLVLPYRKILNSGSAHLGLSFATPIVAPKIGCLPETVPPENDLLYDPAADGLTRALRQAYESTDLDRVGRANYQRARALNWDRTCELLLDVYVE